MQITHHRGHCRRCPDDISYAFNENVGTSATDATGNGRTGTIANAAWTASGKFGAALTFNGTNAMVSIADHNSLDLTTGMTLEAWVYPTTLGLWRTAILNENGGSLAYALYANENVSRPSSYVSIGGDQSAAGAVGLPLNTWSHLAATYDGAVLRTYVNGVQVGTRTSPAASPCRLAPCESVGTRSGVSISSAGSMKFASTTVR